MYTYNYNIIKMICKKKKGRLTSNLFKPAYQMGKEKEIRPTSGPQARGPFYISSSFNTKFIAKLINFKKQESYSIML